MNVKNSVKALCTIEDFISVSQERRIHCQGKTNIEYFLTQKVNTLKQLAGNRK